jgi:hypothetical protein
MQSGIVEKFVRAGVQSIVPGNLTLRTSLSGQTNGSHGCAEGTEAGDAPRIELVRNGDVVQAIDVTCSCGKSFRLWCSYENNGSLE